MGSRGTSANSEALAFVVDQLPVGVVLVDAATQIAWLNTSARLLIQRGDGVGICDGRLSARSREQDAALALLLRRAVDAADQRAPHDPEALAIPRSDGSAPLVLVIRPVELPEAQRSSCAAKAVVFLSDPAQGLRANRLRLQQLFALTPAVADLVALLAAGHDLGEAATALQISRETARTYLKRAFEKTGTHRQAELVRLALAAATAGAVEE